MRSLGVVLLCSAALAIFGGLHFLARHLQEKQRVEELKAIREALGGAGEERAKVTEKKKEMPVPTKPVTKRGSERAKVRVVAVIPTGIDCHAATIQILNEIAEAEPERIRVEIYDMQTPQGQSYLARHGIHCASVFVNDKTEFKIKVDGETKYILCQRRPNSPMSTYYSTDLIEIVHHELKRLYGEGFDPATLERLREKGRKIVFGGAEEVLALNVPPGKKARVVVEVLMPHSRAPFHILFEETVKTLKRLKGRYPDTLAVYVYSLMSEKGQKRLEELGLSGPAVVINGKTRHRIPLTKGIARTINTEFGGGPSFSASDIEEIVEFYLREGK